MNISELARQTGVSIRSLRYYETKQLLSPQREENGYRVYDSTAVARVRMIQFYLRLGLTSNEIFDVIGGCGSDYTTPFYEETEFCAEEADLYKEKLESIETQIAALEQARMYLKQRLARIEKVLTV